MFKLFILTKILMSSYIFQNFIFNHSISFPWDVWCGKTKHILIYNISSNVYDVSFTIIYINFPRLVFYFYIL